MPNLASASGRFNRCLWSSTTSRGGRFQTCGVLYLRPRRKCHQMLNRLTWSASVEVRWRRSMQPLSPA